MENKIIWFDRKFVFDIKGDMYPIMVERMRGVPARLEEKIKNVPEEILMLHTNGWSIKEQVGHLLTVEELWHKRVENYRNQDEHLFPADLNNTATKETDFNSMDISDLLNKFRKSREKLVKSFESFKENEVERISHHPRLNTPMRLIDTAYFIVEHDDHHLSKIHDILTAIM